MSGFDINTVTVSGNLTREPEVRNIPGSGQAVCSFSIAHNERYKDASGEWTDRACFFDVTVWSGLGEWMGRNLHKGQKVVVSGRLKWREWEQDGNKRQAVDIVADSVVPVVRDGAGGGQSNGYSARSDVPTDMSDFQQPQPATVGGGGGGRSSADDDIPF